ncbi:pregnancy-specific beta-1-glycoprotein 4 isoform X1 [Polypterus senegalus]|uniref:pregnancy-specific beta-1-glycoprotein 4 isoform X1 n=1 Tax=Polypterus senegalus TaxID=55291 RepID=UPI001963EBA3|nr:pregnancy-specific beta-1-glycoprotein 4 isoform X1 [Polypterus senegalus]
MPMPFSIQTSVSWLMVCNCLTRLVSSEDTTIYGGTQEDILLHPSRQLTNAFTFSWRKDQEYLAKFKNNNVFYYGAYDQRAQLFLNGTIKLENVSKNDSGLYMHEAHDKEGRLVNQERIHVEILDPVSKPLVTGCHTGEGKMTLSCSSEKGDNLSFGWILNGSVVSSSCNHTVERNATGKIYCFGENKISRELSDPVNLLCLDPVSKPLVTTCHTGEGKMTLLCSSEKGDNVSFGWILNGSVVSSSFNLTVDRNVTGKIYCFGENKISRELSDPINLLCLGHRTKVIKMTSGIVTFSAILLLLFCGALKGKFHAGTCILKNANILKNKRCPKETSTAVKAQPNIYIADDDIYVEMKLQEKSPSSGTEKISSPSETRPEEGTVNENFEPEYVEMGRYAKRREVLSVSNVLLLTTENPEHGTHS